MKLSAIALKNLKRNFSFYFLYLFSVSFVLMIYFCFTSFSMNQIIMEKISSDGRVETMCRIVEDLIDIEKREIALEILKLKKLSLEEIAKCSKLPLEEVEKIAKDEKILAG